MTGGGDTLAVVAKAVLLWILGAASWPGLLAIDWSSTIGLGSVVVGIVVALAGLAVLGYGARWKAAATASEAGMKAERDTREAFKARADRLEIELRETRARNEELAHLIGEQKKTIARLEALPNLERVVNLMAEQQERADVRATERLQRGLTAVEDMVDARVTDHEKFARERHEQLLAALSDRPAE